jgi:putative membrane protein
MNKEHSISFHYYMRSFIILALSIYISYLIKHDTLQYYIAPRMMVYVKWSSPILFVIAFSSLYTAFRLYRNTRAASDCEHPPSRSAIKNAATYGLLILPLLFGFLSPDTTMNSALAAKKGMILNISTAVSQIYKPAADEIVSTDVPLTNTGNEPSGSNDQFTPIDPHDMDFAKLGIKLFGKEMIQINPEIFMEELRSIDLFVNNFIDKKVEITGFIYREKGMKDNQFVTARFALQCCSADATPYGVMIEYSNAKSYADDTWVKISGTIQKTNYKGNDIMKINATKIEKIEVPKSPYVYPNLEFLEEEL